MIVNDYDSLASLSAGSLARIVNSKPNDKGSSDALEDFL